MALKEDWSRNEVEATVASYRHMLMLELSGQPYNKSAYRRALVLKLNNRSEKAVENKHQNISAILKVLGFPWISGYKPYGHFQKLLFEVVENRFTNDTQVDEAALKATTSTAIAPLLEDYGKVFVDAPTLTAINEPDPTPYYSFVPKKRDYLEREARNLSLGKAGEEFVLNFERFRLNELGKKKLAEKVEHTSEERGDGLGYDILSFEPDGREKFIEVKTTAFGKETPFFISRGEIQFAKDYAKQYHLYRLFEFRKAPKLFDLPGAVESHCLVNPINFICEFS